MLVPIVPGNGVVGHYIDRCIIESTNCIAAYILNFMHEIHVRTVCIHIASLIAINRNQIQCCHAVNFTLSSCMVGSVPVTYTLFMEARK